jgi:hypothetical protein
LSTPSSTLFAATFLHSTLSQRLHRHLKVVQFFINWIDFPELFFLQGLILELIFNSFCFESVIVMFFSFSFSSGAGYIVKDSVLKSSARTDFRLN